MKVLSKKYRIYSSLCCFFLWIAGLVLVIYLTSVRYLDNSFLHPLHSYKAENEDVANIIDSVLLNISDLQFSEKKEFINLLLLSPGDEYNTSTTLEKRNTIYKTILEKRINKVKRTGTSDFYIKPVPK